MKKEKMPKPRSRSLAVASWDPEDFWAAFAGLEVAAG